MKPYELKANGCKSGSERQGLHVSSHMWKRDSKDKHTQKQAWSYTNLYVEHICNSGTTLWNSGEGARKREQQSVSSIKIHCICAGKAYNMY
jgi:hypothetical protein